MLTYCSGFEDNQRYESRTVKAQGTLKGLCNNLTHQHLDKTVPLSDNDCISFPLKVGYWCGGKNVARGIHVSSLFGIMTPTELPAFQAGWSRLKTHQPVPRSRSSSPWRSHLTARWWAVWVKPVLAAPWGPRARWFSPKLVETLEKAHGTTWFIWYKKISE